MRSGNPADCHRCGWRQASRGTHAPIGRISTLSSATGMNVPGGHDAARRVPPAQQCFGAACPAAHDIDPRLIVQLELAARERLVQLALEAPPLLREAAHSRADALECPAPALSGAVHGPLGVPYERIGCVAGARIQADADARGDEHFERIQPQRPADRLNELGGDDPGLLPVADMARESEEFITAHARDRVPRAHRNAQPVRHLVPAQPPVVYTEPFTVIPLPSAPCASTSPERQ